MHLTREEIQNTERIRRLNIINSITGIKPANLIGTVSDDGKTNLAIFSSVVHLGSNPALIGFIIRPDREAGQHTFDNIRENGYYTINHIHESFIERAHYTSAKFAKDESEFEKCALTEEYLDGFIAPFVKESLIKMGMKVVQTVPIEMNGTVLIIGEVEHLIIPDDAINKEGQIDLSQPNDVGISGLNTYYKLEKIAEFPYARPNALPDFTKKDA
ncbi:flavin reductase family protein [Dyadobacter flavalbus]|uniref:Flavin reductase family protein n=1 Tax=Dyadobacter flavalbus TaxID=2579942 RepID=A0A5M8QSV2_9BACT|nr:flavin reductase family protein [Dyadobacter flavalbus]KAA6439337.1 flavin reductase family protein [Dyadobacter flavalbus]